jgi:hypothetical protein
MVLPSISAKPTTSIDLAIVGSGLGGVTVAGTGAVIVGRLLRATVLLAGLMGTKAGVRAGTEFLAVVGTVAGELGLGAVGRFGLTAIAGGCAAADGFLAAVGIAGARMVVAGTAATRLVLLGLPAVAGVGELLRLRLAELFAVLFAPLGLPAFVGVLPGMAAGLTTTGVGVELVLAGFDTLLLPVLAVVDRLLVLDVLLPAAAVVVDGLASLGAVVLLPVELTTLTTVRLLFAARLAGSIVGVSLSALKGSVRPRGLLAATLSLLVGGINPATIGWSAAGAGSVAGLPLAVSCGLPGTIGWARVLFAAVVGVLAA